MLVRSLTFVAVLALCSSAAVSRADEHAAVTPYLANDVSSVVYFDLDKLKLPAIAAELEKLSLIPESELAEAKRQTTAIQAKLDEMIKLGTRRAYLLVRVSDFFEGGPTLVVEVAEEGEAQAVADWLTQWAAKADALGDAAAYLPKAFVADGGVVVGAGSQQRLAKVRAKQESRRQEAIEALAGLDGVDAGWVAFGDADSRRVVREVFPQLPAPFAEIDGKLLADHLKWLAVTLKLPPDPTVTVAFQASEPEAAAVLENSAAKGLTLAKGMLMAEKLNGPPVHKERAQALLPLLSKLTPRKEDSRLSITFGDDAEEKAVLQDYLPKVVKGAQTKTALYQRMNQFKQITLGMLNYEDTHKALPTAASYDANGKPLLSWRVHILLYVGEDPLYKQFKLDEPWDSEHNRKLIERMPAIYADPDPFVRAALEKGHTTFVVPVGEGLVFGGKEGTKYRDIKDGTSNTILVVDVPPEKAVVWTKPEDWEVNLDDPLSGLKREDREWFTAGYADGHVSIHSLKNEPSVIRALLTPNGGETIDHSQLK
jgi:hypothetical protein